MSILTQDKDKNYLSFYEEGKCSDPDRSAPRSPVSSMYEVAGGVFTPPLAEQFDDIVRLHKATMYHFKDCVIDGQSLNKEDGLDLNNRCMGNLFERCIIAAGQHVAITCKGGSSHNTWRNCVIRGRGKFVDIEFGNHSDQVREKSRDNRLIDVHHEDGKAVRVAWGYNAQRPKIHGGNVKIVWWWVVVLHAYTFLKSKLKFIP